MPIFLRVYNSLIKIERKRKQGWSTLYLNVFFSAIDRQEEGDSRVEMDKNSCDRNEECSVRKGLASTSEVCFHSLIREPGGRCCNRVMNSVSA